MIKLIHDANMTDDEIYARTQEFFDRIEKGFQRIGMKLKRAESWMSSELYIFGKDIYYRGNRMPLRSKRAGNTSRYSSTDRYSLSTAAQQLNSGLKDLNNECHSILPAYVLGRILTGRLAESIQKCGIPGWGGRLSITRSQKLSLPHSSFGIVMQPGDSAHIREAVYYFSNLPGLQSVGICGVDKLGMLMSMSVDPVSSFLSYSRRRLSQEDYHWVCKLLFKITSPSNYTKLVKDVYGINVCTPYS